MRSRITVDLSAIRRNAALVLRAVAPSELWAVVKADGYGHGAVGAARAALEAGATCLCAATAREGEELREAFPSARILVLTPLAAGEEAGARDARLELALSTPNAPDGLDVHLKIDTGMGRWGMTLAEALTVPRRQVVGVMSHLATAEEPDDAFVRLQIDRFREVVDAFPGVTAHLANSAGALRFPEARFDAVRSGVALYGLSPFGEDPAEHGLEPALSWQSYVAQARELAPGESTGYGRRFVAEEPVRVGIVPVGYGDGFRRGLTGTEVLVGETRRRVVGTISMDSFAVRLGDEPVGTEVTLIGEGVLAEQHARVLGTINYEITCGLNRDRSRAERSLVGG
jgi:alanine racemase